MSDAGFLDAADEDVRAAWADLLTRSAQATPFSTLAYAEALRDVLGIPYRLAGSWKDERLTAGVLLFEKRLGPYRLVVVPPTTPVTSFLLATPLRESDVTHRRCVLDALIETIAPEYHAMAFHLHPALSDVRPFQWHGFAAHVLYTYRQAIPERNVLLKQASRSVRRTVKRPEGLTVGESENSSEGTELVMHSYQRKERRFPLTPAQQTALTERLRQSGLARIFAARDADSREARGVQVMLCDDRSAYHWIGGSHRGPAKTLLVVEAMEQLRREGLDQIDMVGANTPSVAEFKRSFGLPLTPYYRVVRLRRPELKALHAVRPLL